MEPVGRGAEVEMNLSLGEVTCLKEAGVNRSYQKKQGYAGGGWPAQRETGRNGPWFGREVG